MKIPRGAVLGLVLAALGLNGAATADVWDIATASDDDDLTSNRVNHGGLQVHDLGVRPGPVADQDWYRANTPPYSSQEVVVEGMTGDLFASGLDVDRVDAGGTVLNTSVLMQGGFARSLRWFNTTATPESFYVRVQGAACATTCSVDDQYTIRFYDTTYSTPRFNNSGGQVTVLILQNADAQEAVTGDVYFWSSTGALLATSNFGLAPHQLFVLNTAGVVGLQGVGGSITVSSPSHYGAISGKAVALEPSTGFSFDSPMLPKP